MITRERWQRIKAIFDSAQACPPAERPGFLDEACGSDEFIRREVESLLAADADNEDFLGAPAYEFAAGMLAEGEAEFAAGQQIGRYTILEVLGSGGMGEVYLAQDGRLGRRIALKLISADFAGDEKRVRRFEQEASVASRLNHPNVCVIHEIGVTEDGRHFIAMEHVDGMTLRDRMTRKQLKPAEALQVAIQVAAALEAAHKAGIVHRDIKPENIMLRRDGYIKVLDFGLAKLSEKLSRPRDFHEASTARVRTEPGMFMGTVRYMSPEQLREASVDERTDIWSLGVVLYEMVTGSTPFEAPTTNDTIALILGKQPPEFTFADDLPLKFQQVIRKALTKDRVHRYQTVTELAADLKQVRRELRRRREIGSSPEVLTLHLEPVDTKPQPTPGKSTIFFRLRSQARSTANLLVSEIKQHKKAAIFTGASAVFAALLLVPKLQCWSGRVPCSGSQSTPSWQTTKITPLTNSGTSVCAAISPDGKYVAHAEEKNGRQSLLLTTIATGAPSVMVQPGEVEYRGITFSLDGNYVYFTLRKGKGEPGVLHQVPFPGGVPRKIKEGVDSPISFSPNGDRFAFVRFNNENGEYSLMIANVDGTDERAIATRRGGNKFSVEGPAWSPDGKTIVCPAGSWQHGYHMSLVDVDVKSGAEKSVGAEWFFVFQVAWLQDKSGLVMLAKEQPLSPIQLWRLSYPQGETKRLTNDRAEYQSLSLSRDGATIVSVQGHELAQLWVAPEGNFQNVKPIASTVGRTYGMDWTTNGKIVFSAMAGNNLNISAINADGSDQRQLTGNNDDNYTPSISPDGRYVVFTSNRGGRFNIWRMNAEDGSEPRQLTQSDGNSYPSYSADGRWVLYDNQSSDTVNVWRVPVDGGDPAKLIDTTSRMPVVSPDNQFIACRYETARGRQQIVIVPFQGGKPIRVLPITIMDFQRVQWTADGRAVMYIKSLNGASNIWKYDLSDGSSSQLTDFKSDLIFSYAWSRDYKQLACARGSEVRDVMIISSQK